MVNLESENSANFKQNFLCGKMFDIYKYCLATSHLPYFANAYFSLPPLNSTRTPDGIFC